MSLKTVCCRFSGAATLELELDDHFHDLTRAVQNWMSKILNYFKHYITNAYTDSLNNLIRVMDRMGRGYSFKALRVKILFTEGTHQKKCSRPKFERIDLSDFGHSGGNVMHDQLFNLSRWTSTPKSRNQHKGLAKTLNYGASISALVRLIEEGKL